MNNTPLTYTISKNETLFSISQKTGIPVDELKKYNKINGDAIFPGQVLKLSANDITYNGETSFEEIVRKDYVKETKNYEYKVKQGDNYSTIADKFNVGVNYLLKINNLTGKEVLSIGQVINIPPTRTPQNINSIADVAKAMGVSQDFIKNLKQLEDGYKENGKPFGDNEFHNTAYTDSEGHRTIGIGHVLQKNDKKKLSNKEVLTTFTNDLLIAEENIWAALGSKKNYDKLPQGIKEALLDMTFNKGTAILEDSEGLIWCLKNQKYEAAINKMTHAKSLKGNEMSGLCKRRLFDMSLACKIYNGNIPNSNIATVQNLYNQGIELLKKECKKSGANFENQLVGYNNEVRKYWGNLIKLN